MKLSELDLNKYQDHPMELDLIHQTRLSNRAELALKTTLDNAVKNSVLSPVEALQFGNAYLQYDLEFLLIQQRISVLIPNPEIDALQWVASKKIANALIEARNGRYSEMKECIFDQIDQWCNLFDQSDSEEAECIFYGYIEALSICHELLPENGVPFLKDLPQSCEDKRFMLKEEYMFSDN